MDVAVIIPAHDAAATIALTIASVQAQHRPADEIVVVDDGSRDETAAIVLRHGSSDPRIRLIRQPRAGPAAARNRAITATRAALLAPIDADDLWDPGYLAALTAVMAVDGQAGFAYCRHRLIDPLGSTIGPAPLVPLAGGCFGAMLLTNPVGNGSSALFRRTAVIEAGGYTPPSDEWYGAEDYLLQLRVAARHPILFVDRTLSSYRVGTASLSRDGKAARRARLEAIDAALCEFGPCPLPVRRWAMADAARVHAAMALARGQAFAATASALSAAAADPLGTLGDFLRRLRNLLARAAGCEPAAQGDPLLSARARRLQQAMPYAAPARDRAGTAAFDRSRPRSAPPSG